MKRKKGLLIAAGALALLLAAGLWYVWPRSWENLSNSRSEEVTSLSAEFMLYYFHLEGEEIDLGWDVWSLNAEQAEGAATQAILEALRGCSYRRSLKNLIPRDVWVLDGGKDRVHMGIVWDGAHWASLNVSDNGAMLFNDELYYVDAELCGRLGEIIQEYGFQKED